MSDWQHTGQRDHSWNSTWGKVKSGDTAAAGRALEELGQSGERAMQVDKAGTHCHRRLQISANRENTGPTQTAKSL